jgi:hypothetical protein
VIEVYQLHDVRVLAWGPDHHRRLGGKHGFPADTLG